MRLRVPNFDVGVGMTTSKGSPIIIESLKVAEHCLQHQGQKAVGKAESTRYLQ